MPAIFSLQWLILSITIVIGENTGQSLFALVRFADCGLRNQQQRLDPVEISTVLSLRGGCYNHTGSMSSFFLDCNIITINSFFPWRPFVNLISQSDLLNLEGSSEIILSRMRPSPPKHFVDTQTGVPSSQVRWWGHIDVKFIAEMFYFCSCSPWKLDTLLFLFETLPSFSEMSTKLPCPPPREDEIR